MIQFTYIRGTSIGKNLTWMSFIQVLLCFYKMSSTGSLKKKTLLKAYAWQTIFNIDAITIHSSLFMPFNCKNLPQLRLEQLKKLVKKMTNYEW